MNNFLLDTNIIIDAFSADLLRYFKFDAFYISQVVFREEIKKQISSSNEDDFNLINESYEELIIASDYNQTNKNISYYDALNLSIARERNMILVTGDQHLLKFAVKQNVTCVGTLKIIELLFEKKIISGEECIKGLEKIKLDPKRRIPHHLIDSLIDKIDEVKEPL